MTVQIRLPYPSPKLSPNARVHWSVRSSATKQARDFAGWMAKSKPWPAVAGDGLVHLTITYCPPDKRRRDRDNVEAAGKAARDGLADAWGIDDSRFVITSRWGEVVRGGAMVVEFEV